MHNELKSADCFISPIASRLESEQAGSSDESNFIRHSVCQWCYDSLPLEELCREGKQFGLQSVELLTPQQINTLHQFDMQCAMVTFPTAVAADGKEVGGIPLAWNRPQYHDVLEAAYREQITDAFHAGANNVICFSGNRDGMSDEEGLQHCADGLKRILPLCEKLGITLTMELLNSKIDHEDYMCDRSAWGIALCDLIESDNFKLLYDIYHMQVMEGDVIDTIKKSHRYISHYHTGGVPGRNEIDESQELYYPAIMRAIRDTGYTGFVGQEFIPSRGNPLESLKQGITICTV
ncbi:MAG: hydroxypyruvate isomerase family protein [Mariniblastus sp.]